MTAQDRLVVTATEQVGYLGKKSNTQLDSFTANGGGKYNKFARDLDALKTFYNYPKQGYDWCDVFVDWCFVQTFGRELAQQMIFQPDRSCGAGTAYSLGYYKAKGRLFSTPQVGDQIFFGDAKSTWHTGIVTKVSSGYVSTVEGNAGNPSAVRSCTYKRNYAYIKGYGRPNWALVPGEATAPSAGGQVASPKVGDIVDFLGSRHYTSSSAAKPSSCKPGKARVTAVAVGAAHPYHLIGEPGGSTVYGWVDAADIKP